MSSRPWEALLRDSERAPGGALDRWLREAKTPALAPFLVAADARMTPLADGGYLEAQAKDDLVRALEQRLARLVEVSLFVARERHEPVNEPSVSAWGRHFTRYPELGELVAQSVEQWLTASRELVERVRADGALLADFLGCAHEPNVVGVRSDLGDVHDNGRSVAILELEGGRHVVYKPKNLQVTRAFARLVGWLNEEPLSESLKVPELVVRDGYAWEEYVPFRPCESARDVSLFYLRIGMFLRLFQLLEARDLWLDNLVAHGSQPVFVDYEMILQPRRRRNVELLPAAAAAQRFLDESVVDTGVLTLHTTVGIGKRSEDLGALTPVREFRSPFPSLESSLEMDADVSFATFRRDEYAPVLDGNPMRADLYVDEIVAGFREMNERLRKSAAQLLAKNGPIADFAGLPVRYIHRHTWACYRVLRASTRPDLLTGPRQRRDFLNGLLLGSPNTAMTEAERAIARHEIDCLERLDVPYFLAATDAADLHTSEGLLVPGFFEGSALARARARLAEIHDFPLEKHVSLLLSALSTGPHRVRARERARARRRQVNWLEVAMEVGDQILKAAYRDDAGSAWLGICRDPFHSRCNLQVLPADILSGTAGIAIALAALFGASGEERFRHGALDALATTRIEVRASTERLRDLPTVQHSPRGRPFAAGAFVGVGAQVYALVRCARALSRPELRAEAELLASALPLETIAERSVMDVATGSGGLLLSCIASDTSSKLQRTALVLAEILDDKIRRQGIRPSPYPEGELVDRALPDVWDGLRLAASRLAPAEGPLTSWANVHSEESTTIGRLLTRLSIDGPLGAGVRSEVDRLTVADASPTDCLDGLEIALVAARSLGEDMHLRAQELAASLLHRKRDSGSWFSDRLSADVHELSAVTGLAALVNALVGLVEPPSFRSIRLVE